MACYCAPSHGTCELCAGELPDRADLLARSRFLIWDRAAAGSWIPGSGSAKYGIVLTLEVILSQGVKAWNEQAQAV